MECKCDMRTKLAGDGCEMCNPELAAMIAADNARRKQAPEGLRLDGVVRLQATIL